MSVGRKAQLDGLRAIAVALVFVDHLIPAPGLPPQTDFSWWEPGAAGVRLFFVLSGFLITGILIEARTEAEVSGLSIFGVWRAFYIRRALRIFPVAYAALLLGAALHVSQGLGWYAAYLGNLYVARIDAFDALGHFWSLAVEEQFYLLWPLLVLLVPRRAHVAILIGIILTAGVSRGLYVHHGHWTAAYVLPWARMDALAAGGLLALARYRGRTAGVGILLVASGLLLPSSLAAVVTEWGSITICAELVARASQGRLGAWLAWRPMVYIGAISYGLYVWHPFLFAAAHGLERRLAPGFSVPILAASVALSVLLAAASWHWLERPFNDLKRFVPYVSRPAAAALASPGGSSASSRRAD